MEPVTSVSSRESGEDAPSAADGRQRRAKDRYWLHVLLFVVTLGTTVYIGGELTGRWRVYAEEGLWAYVLDGLRYGVSLLLFLTVHEFGHYFAARRHGVDTSLPYYIPLPLMAPGTLGAVIRIREPVPSMRKLFDIGVAGPVAGFVVALGVLLYALATLPPPTYVMDLGRGHEAIQRFVEQYGRYPEEMLRSAQDGASYTLVVGDTLLYWIIKQFFADVPPMYEMYHFPALFAGWLGLFFTALNLMPVGQLDGGHVAYALFGRTWHSRLARGFFLVLLISGSIGFTTDAVALLYDLHPMIGEGSWFILAAILYFFLSKVFRGDLKILVPVLLGIMCIVVTAQSLAPWLQDFGWNGWLVWCLLIVLLIKVDHPPVLQYEPLTRGRFILGILSIAVFVLCFSFRPLYIVT